jgi:hypothetical protein
MARQQLTVDQAATALGISTDAVRKRARRGTLEAEKGADGTVYVWVDGGTPDGSTPTQAHLDSMQDQIDYLRQQLDRAEERDRENRRIIAAITQRIPAIEAPEDSSPEAREAPVPSSQEQGDGVVPSEQVRRSWWQRWFGG